MSYLTNNILSHLQPPHSQCHQSQCHAPHQQQEIQSIIHLTSQKLHKRPWTQKKPSTTPCPSVLTPTKTLHRQELHTYGSSQPKFTGPVLIFPFHSWVRAHTLFVPYITPSTIISSHNNTQGYVEELRVRAGMMLACFRNASFMTSTLEKLKQACIMIDAIPFFFFLFFL